MPRYLVHFKSKGGDQYMELMAADRDEAKQLAERAQFRRHERFPLTFSRIQQAHELGNLSKEQFKAELERRKRDVARYDDGDIKVASIKEVT